MAPKPIDVEVRATGVDGVRRQLRLVGDEAGPIGEKYSRAGEAIGGAFLQIAHHGEVSSRELKELLREGGEMAAMFGSAGPIIGGIALFGAALFEAISKGNEELEKTTNLLRELGDEYLKLTNEIKGNKLAVAEIDLNDAYNKKIKEIKEQEPGKISRAWAEILSGAAVLMGSSSLLQEAFRAYTGRQLGTALDTRTEGAVRLKQEEKIRKEDQEELDRKADEAAKKLEEARKRAFEGAAFLAANDLGDNANLIRILLPKWTGMWREFGLDAQVKQQTTEIVKNLIESSIADATKETNSTLNSALADALRGVRDLQAKGPPLGRGFSGGLKKEFDEITASTKDFSETLGTLVADQIPALASGFEQAFEAIGRGENVFKAVGGAALQMVQRVASQLAVEEFAQGLAMLARSIWDFLGPNPAAGLSATQHFAAAAMFGTIAGVSGAASGAGRGGGYGGGLTTSSVSSATQGVGRKTTIVFKGRSFINLADPDQRAELIQNLRDLYGDGDLNFIFE